MKRLILIRHGDAPRSPNHDLERSLSLIGEKQAATSGGYLKSYKIDKVLCSPTKRTIQTLQLLQGPAGIIDDIVEFVDDIYINTVDVLLSLVAAIEHVEETILVVGHNPSLLDLAITYDSSAEEKWQNELALGLKPAEVIVLEFPQANNWHELASDTGKITDMFVP